MLALPPRGLESRDHRPPKPSPLSPSHPNVKPGFLLLPPMEPAEPSERRDGKYQRQPVKANPLLRADKDGKERRRNLFLKKVRQGGEDRRWEARGGDEELMRSIFVSERKRWEAMQARLAPAPLVEDEEEIETDHDNDDGSLFDIDMSTMDIPDDVAEYSTTREESGPDRHPASSEPQSVLGTSQDHEFGSEDEDYDRLFLELCELSDGQGASSSQRLEVGAQGSNHDSMDTSHG
ncbi:MAG: hypothetical protein M1817_004043 [Caeruleum heppii]|nr:MAG: hypothetical protein M1817_004043 [Caeruleum heppii]